MLAAAAAGSGCASQPATTRDGHGVLLQGEGGAMSRSVVQPRGPASGAGARAAGCARETRRASRAWVRLLLPHLAQGYEAYEDEGVRHLERGG